MPPAALRVLLDSIPVVTRRAAVLVHRLGTE